MQALSGLSGLSGVVSAAGPPAAPAGLTVTPNAGDGTQMSVSWTASGGALTYDLQRSTDNSTWTTVSSAQAGTTFGDTGLSYNTLYYYRVRSTNLSGNSAYSTSASATTAAYDPGTLADHEFWYAARLAAKNAAGAACTNGIACKTWPDNFSTANDAVQSTVADQATFLTGQVNGLPALSFDGSDDFYALTSAIAQASQPGPWDNWSLYVVCNPTLGSDNAILGDTGSAPQVRQGTSGANVLTTYDGANLINSSTLGVAQGVWQLLEFVCVSNVVTFWQNGVSYGTATFNIGAVGLKVSVVGILGGVIPFNGKIAEMLLVSHASGTTERQNLESLFRSLYTLY